MKKVFFLLSFLLTSFSFAQPGGLDLTEEAKEIKALQLEILSLISPDTFSIQLGDRSIIVTLKDTVLPMGLISAPNYTDSVLIHHPAFANSWTQYVIEFRLETKKNETEKKRVLDFNDSIWLVMKNLPKKLGIEHCRSEKNTYYAKTKKDEKKIDLFVQQKQWLYDQLIPIPRFSTQYLDVYVSDDKVFDGYYQHPEWDAYYLCPGWANQWRWKIWDEVKKLEKKYKK